MACFCPLTGYWSRTVNAETGKRGITFDRNASFSGVKLLLPCGQCVGCRLERSRQWAMRCVHEKRFHKVSEFLTLTYDKLPEYGSLVKRDLQLFNKRLRKRMGPFRFYACGEYGDENRRPHYHMILFGLTFPDKRFYKRAKDGSSLYTSKLLEEIWSHGLCVIGDVSFESCAYVARYVTKKVTGKAAEAHYEVMTSDGELVRLTPEFTVMSRRPGIGKAYFDKYKDEVYTHDSVVINGREVRPPRYYDLQFDVIESKRMELLRKMRRRKAMAFRADNVPDRLRVREVLQLKRLQDLKRGVT